MLCACINIIFTNNCSRHIIYQSNNRIYQCTLACSISTNNCTDTNINSIMFSIRIQKIVRIKSILVYLNLCNSIVVLFYSKSFIEIEPLGTAIQ